MDVGPPQVPPDIVTFATDPDFLGKKLYPRQKTLLRLMFLETENFTAYDEKVINEWRKNWNLDPSERVGVPPDIFERIEILKAQGRPHFRETEFIGGRRGGKGHIGGIVVLRRAG